MCFIADVRILYFSCTRSVHSGVQFEDSTPYVSKKNEKYVDCILIVDTWKCIYVIIRVARCPVFDRTVRFFGDLSGQKYDAKPDN